MSKTILLRCRLKNEANKTKGVVDIAVSGRQRDYVVVLNKKPKYNYFNNLKARKGVKFPWKTSKRDISNKHSKVDTSIILITKNELILNNRKITMAFRDHFAEIIPSINTFKWTWNVKGLVNHVYIIDRTLLKFYNHSSIKMI